MHSLWLITVVVLSLEGCFSVATGQPLREEPELDQSKIEQASSSSVENKSAEEDSESPFFEPALHPVFASVLEKLHASLASLRDRTASVISNLEEKEGNSDESVVNPEHIVSEESPKCDGLISCMRVHVIRVPMIRNFLTSMNSLSNDQSANSGSDNMTTNPQPPSPSDLPAAPLLRITIHRSFITDNNDSSRIEPLMRFSDAFQSPPLDSIPPPPPSSHVMCNEAADCGIPMLSAEPSSSSNVYPEPEWGPHAHYRKHPRRRHSHHGPHPRYPPLVLIGLGAAGMSLMIGLVAIFVRCFSATTDTRHPYESLNTVVVRRKTVPI